MLTTQSCDVFWEPEPANPNNKEQGETSKAQTDERAVFFRGGNNMISHLFTGLHQNIKMYKEDLVIIFFCVSRLTINSHI